jgi:glycosyltransferase involved in cell wall biosynthesis
MLPRYEAILTASSHMRREYLKYDVPSDRVHAVGLMIPQRAVLAARQVPGSSSSDVPGERDISRTWRLLFVARLTPMKGGAMLLKTLPLLRKMFSGRIVLTVAGEGPDRPSMEADASRLRSKDPHLHIRFAGWLGPDEIAAALRATDLLVVPSIWPEPFGLVGPEAGIHAVPSAAFAVGGIPDWLRDGVNGHVAPGDPPTAEGLADAITRSLVSADHHMRLCAGALAQAAELNPERHIPRVVGILAQAVAARQGRELA